MSSTGNRLDDQWDRRKFLSASLAMAGGGLLLAGCGSNGTSSGSSTSGGSAASGGSSSGASAGSASGSSSTGSGTSGSASGSSSASSGSSTAQRKSASVRFNWTVKGEFSGFFVAREKGFYDEENLDISLNEGKSGTQAVQVVGTGNDTFGYVPSIQVIQGINKQVPLTTVATMGRYTGMCWASWPNVPLKGANSLVGKQVSISTSSTFFQVWPAFEKDNDLSGKVHVVHPDPSARDGLFLSHKLDIMADIFYANDWPILEVRADEAHALKSGQKLNVLRMSELNFDPLGYLFVANNSVMKSDPDLVRRMIRATIKGYQYVIDHTDESVSIMQKLYGKRLGNKVIDLQMHNMLDLLVPKLGHSTEDMWNESLNLLSKSGVIKKKLSIDSYYTDEFLS